MRSWVFMHRAIFWVRFTRDKGYVTVDYPAIIRYYESVDLNLEKES